MAGMREFKLPQLDIILLVCMLKQHASTPCVHNWAAALGTDSLDMHTTARLPTGEVRIVHAQCMWAPSAMTD